MAEHPPYEVIGHWQARQWRKWTYDAADWQLLAALRGAGDSWESVPARECSDELKNRGYTLVGAYPHEVLLEKPEGQPVRFCDRCQKQVEALYDLTPAAMSDYTTYYVCKECYEDAARELAADGSDVDLG